MQDSFELLEYLDFLGAHRRFCVVACAVALGAALAACFLLPKRYTATATVLIDPPAGEDPRMATAVSNVYLESLKTYELLATNDQLFVRAAERFHLRDNPSVSLESLKRRTLKVDKLRDTRAIEISVTWGDPRVAQAVAQFIADGMVALNRTGSREAGDAMIADAARAAAAAQARLNQAEKAWQQAAAVDADEALRSEIYENSSLKSRAEENLLNEQASLPESGGAGASAASKARVAILQQRITELARTMDQQSAELARRAAREENLEAALNGARTSYETVAQRLEDLPVSLGSRSEWLRVIDPGIVPQRPSSPNMPLILIGAEALALFLSWLYLTMSFSLTRGRRKYRPQLRLARHGAN